MQARFDLKAAQAASDAGSAIRTLEESVRSCGLEPSLIALVVMRVSQINRCSWSIRSYIRDARQNGETEERLYLLRAWRDATTPYNERERAALAWAEALTLVAETHETDKVHEQVREQFCDEEIAKLTLLAGATNLWNRLAIGFRSAARATEPSPESAELA
ncbi:MAG: carboxymuconolactone decarboxylase family protein [Mesorhizobium sp.]|uniref:carboxymuconolactone decarboxylase family protein n=1 Tax=Mesorhizobium sp. TaxID=1871066 RepID=UPI00120503A0|nr:carboxymuconolactone decarboxylase family protein [Mesorhizobium sp.]TIQ38037.1 MAG: carboxymuconolactone decarboxylase family protein [Mesorhizobium sp.]